MIVAITYGDKNFSQSLKLNLQSAIKRGKVNKILQYGPEDLDEKFKNENHEILSSKRGAGYWLWKPYVINDAMDKIREGDYLVYADSGSFYIKNIRYIINFIEKEKTDIFLGQLEHKESKYSKRDAFYYIGVDGLGFEKSNQYEASFILIRKSTKTSDFVKKWLMYSCDRRIISDDENTCGLPNYKGFIENRYDQTVLSLVAKKYGYKGYRPVDTSPVYLQSNYSSNNLDDYPQIIIRTRLRNTNNTIFRIKVIIKIILYLKSVYLK